jgi:hypothetical protein
VNNFDELFRRAATVVLSGIRIDKVIPDVVFQHNGQQAVHCSATTRNPLQNIRAVVLSLKRPFDGLNLPFDTADPVKKFPFFLNRMTHCASRYPSGVYNRMSLT